MESCPYNAEAQEASLSELNKIPATSQMPMDDQKSPLSTKREHSTIPMGGKYQDKVWIYPSEQMFYNAMRRKNWDPKEQDMKVVVPIHNVVNEQAWMRILEWESLDENKCQPRLLKFEGRPRDFTIKARIREFLGYKLPFDRHDWKVDRCGETITYVIDFYTGNSLDNSSPASFFLDVRPTLTIDGIFKRFKMFFKNGTGIW